MQAGLAPDVAIYNGLLRLGLQQGKTPAQLLDVVEEMLAAGIAPEGRTFEPVIRAYTREGDVEAALDVIQRVHDMGTYK